jgi:predicted ATPase
MIRSFYIDNFKSLVDFRLPPLPHELGGITCLVGLNGAGKSTVLQAFDFIGHMATGQVENWLKQREWKKADLTSRFLNRQLIRFELGIDVHGIGRVLWSGAFNTTQMRCTAETVTVDGEEQVLHISEGHLQVSGTDSDPSVYYPLRSMKYTGSTLSFINVREVHEALAALKHVAANLRSFDLLTPQSMRRRAKEATDIGYGGERLGAYLHGLDRPARDALFLAMQTFYPQLKAVGTKVLQGGMKDLRFEESYAVHSAAAASLQTSSRQVNDGMLRMLAILSQVSVPEPADSNMFATGIGQSCVLFDEIENGINPELVARLVELLLHAKRQVIVTTHSPMILNFLPDDVARQAVLLLYRNGAGHTRVLRMFDLPSTQEKLKLLGPGEVFVDTDLETLPAEAEGVTTPSASTRADDRRS